jgi:hypothetical protein
MIMVSGCVYDVNIEGQEFEDCSQHVVQLSGLNAVL